MFSCKLHVSEFLTSMGVGCVVFSPQHTYTVTVVEVVMSVCLSIKSHLWASVRHENAKYSAGNEIKVFVAVSLKLLRCRD